MYNVMAAKGTFEMKEAEFFFSADTDMKRVKANRKDCEKERQTNIHISKHSLVVIYN